MPDEAWKTVIQSHKAIYETQNIQVIQSNAFISDSYPRVLMDY